MLDVGLTADAESTLEIVSTSETASTADAASTSDATSSLGPESSAGVAPRLKARNRSNVHSTASGSLVQLGKENGWEEGKGRRDSKHNNQISTTEA